MKIKRSLVAPVVVAVIGLTTGGWLLQRGVDPEQNVYLQSRLLGEVVDYVSKHFVEEKNPDQLYHMAIDGMMQELGDPHSVFMTPDDYADLRMQTHGEYGGLGIEIDIRDGWLTVISPLPNSPAERVGLQGGDRIIKVEGESTKGWTTDKAVSVLRGPKGSTVHIAVARLGIDDPIPFDITRDAIEISAVPEAYMLDPQTGYVELTVFSETATDSLRNAINRLRSQGAKSLVLDMRRNSGGLLDQGIGVADLFLPQRQLVLETRGRTPDQNHVFHAAHPDEYAGMNVAVLIGMRSASATEIVAGALQDHDRAVLVGTTSFGKGSVQTLYNLPGNNILKLTTARWFTPSGRSIQKPYGIGSTPEAEAATAQEEDRAPAGAARSEPQKDSANVPVYHTDSGRQVLGGGGITPDLLVLDTLTEGEQALVEALDGHVNEFNNALYAYAVDYAHAHPELKPGFAVTPEMLAGFHQALAKHGVDVDPSVFEQAAPLISHRLANEVSVNRFGREEAWKRLMSDDPQVAAAVDLLHGAGSNGDLFAQLPAYAQRKGLTLGTDYKASSDPHAGMR